MSASLPQRRAKAEMPRRLIDRVLRLAVNTRSPRLGDAPLSSRSSASVIALATLVAPALVALPAWGEAPVLETVTVTAQKRTENLQDVSQAVTAMSDLDLDARNIVSFVDLSAVAPGVTVAKNEGFKTVIAIRGVGNEANQNAIANPSVSYHLDGIYVASPFALHTDFLDIDRIEVLRGPQGTLFGQNSTGGALNVVTRTPDARALSAEADLALGSYGGSRLRAAANVPISDTLAARASVSARRHDGFSRNVALDQALDDADQRSARMRVRWTPNDQWELDFIAQIHREDRNGAAQKGILDTTPGARRLRQDSRAEFELDSRLFGAVATILLPKLTIEYLTSYQDDDIWLVRDNDRHDLASLPPFALVPAVFDPETNRQTTRTHELHFISGEPLERGSSRFEWVAGVFFLDTAVDILIREYLDFGFDGRFDPVTVEQVRSFAQGDYGFISDSRPQRDSRSVYGQGSTPLGQRARLIAGLRYTRDDVRSAVTNFFGRAGTDRLVVDSKALTGRVALEVDVADAGMAYAAYTRGFKPGGSNLTYGREEEIAPVVVLPTYKAETIDAFEVGAKVDLAGGAVRVNAAAFFYDYRNLQYQATDPEVFEGGVGNVPDATSVGLELEVQTSLSAKLTLDGRLAWLSTEIASRHLALDNVASDAATNALLAAGRPLFGPEIQRARAAAITDVQGNELAKTPRLTGGLLLRYVDSIGAWGEWSASAQYTYRGEFWQRIFNNPRTDAVPSYGVANLSFGVRPGAANWAVELLLHNATDEAGVNARFTDVFGVGATGEELIPPRQAMVRLSVRR